MSIDIAAESQQTELLSPEMIKPFYLDTLLLIGRLHRLLLDIIKDEFEFSEYDYINPVQGLVAV